MQSLVLSRGYQTHDGIGHFEANANPTALATLIGYTQGSDASLQINGCTFEDGRSGISLTSFMYRQRLDGDRILDAGCQCSSPQQHAS